MNLKVDYFETRNYTQVNGNKKIPPFFQHYSCFFEMLDYCQVYEHFMANAESQADRNPCKTEKAGRRDAHLAFRTGEEKQDRMC